MGNKQSKKRLNKNQSTIDLRPDSPLSKPKDSYPFDQAVDSLPDPRSDSPPAPNPRDFRSSSPKIPSPALENLKIPSALLENPRISCVQIESPKISSAPLESPKISSDSSPKDSIQRFQRNSLITIKELDSKIQETKEKIKDVDQEIKSLESTPMSSKKLLFLSKMKRENLNKFVDDLILKQYFLDKKLFETSVRVPEIVESETNPKPAKSKEKEFNFRDILREQRKSDYMAKNVKEVSNSLSNDLFVHPDASYNNIFRDDSPEIKNLISEINSIAPEETPEITEPPKKTLNTSKPHKNIFKAFKTTKPKLNPFCRNSRTPKPNQLRSNRLSSMPSLSRQPKAEIPWYLQGTAYDPTLTKP